MLTIFFPPRNPRLSKAISIKSPSSFRESLRKVRKLKGISPLVKVRALALAKARATAQLQRPNISVVERAQFRAIRRMNIPSMK